MAERNQYYSIIFDEINTLTNAGKPIKVSHNLLPASSIAYTTQNKSYYRNKQETSRYQIFEFLCLGFAYVYVYMSTPWHTQQGGSGPEVLYLTACTEGHHHCCLCGMTIRQEQPSLTKLQIE